MSRNALKARIANLSTEQILSAVVAIGGDSFVAIEERLVRALLIDEFINREGVKAGDTLIQSIGL